MAFRFLRLASAYAFVLYFLVAISAEDSSEELIENSNSSEDFNDTSSGNKSQDLYVIKTVVYEVGILTDSNSTSNETDDSMEEVDLQFFEHGNSSVDLSHIPIPIQANVSGVEVTGLLPAGFGALLNGTEGDDLSKQFLFPGKQVKVSQNISTLDPAEGGSIVANLPLLLGLGKGKENGTTPEED